MRAKGIFISEFQNSFEYLGNIRYIWQRVTDGMVVDTRYHAMLPEVKKVPFRGAVHNYRVHKTWKEQADKFLSLLDDSFQMIAGDYEDSPLALESAIDFWNWIHYVMDKTNKPVVFYCNASTLKGNLNAANGIDTIYGVIDWNTVPLWFARPVTNFDLESEPNLIYGGEVLHDDWHFYQHNWTAPGSKYGCGSTYVCEDVYNGEDLQEWIDSYGEPPAPVNLESLIRANALGIAELARRLDNLLQGQLELAENGLGYEKQFVSVNKAIDNWIELQSEQVLTYKEEVEEYTAKMNTRIDGLAENGLRYEKELAELKALEIEEQLEGLQWAYDNCSKSIGVLNTRIDGLEGGHNHPKWMRKLGLVK